MNIYLIALFSIFVAILLFLVMAKLPAIEKWHGVVFVTFVMALASEILHSAVLAEQVIFMLGVLGILLIFKK